MLCMSDPKSNLSKLALHERYISNSTMKVSTTGNKTKLNKTVEQNPEPKNLQALTRSEESEPLLAREMCE